MAENNAPQSAPEAPDAGAAGAASGAADTPVASPTAGALLRRAREAQGMHIAVLAASLKVPQRKLEALERDRLDQLPDATFARALAQSVCRVLKVDAAAVLALLPPAGAGGLDQVSGGLNTPFRDKPTASEPAAGALLRHPAALAVGALLLAALAVALWPEREPVLPAPLAGVEPAPVDAAPVFAAEPDGAASAAVAGDAAASGPEATAPTAIQAAPAAPAVTSPATPAVAPPAAAAPVAAPAAAAPLLAVSTRADSWVEVTDAAGRTLLSRVVPAGERLALDGTPPLRLVVGNASATELRFRGEVVNLPAAAVNNVARIELK